MKGNGYECHIVVDDMPLKEYVSQSGHTFVTAIERKQFAICLVNHTENRLCFQIRIDGQRFPVFDSILPKSVRMLKELRLDMQKVIYFVFSSCNQRKQVQPDDKKTIDPESLGTIEVSLFNTVEIPEQVVQLPPTTVPQQAGGLCGKKANLFSILSDYQVSEKKIIPYKVHFQPDAMIGVVRIFYRDPRIMRILRLPGLPPSRPEEWPDWLRLKRFTGIPSAEPQASIQIPQFNLATLASPNMKVEDIFSYFNVFAASEPPQWTSFENILPSLNIIVKSSKGGELSLLYALSHQLFGTEEHAQFLLVCTIVEMMQHRLHYKVYLSKQGISYREYMRALQTKSLGENVTGVIHALANFLQIKIVIMSSKLPYCALLENNVLSPLEHYAFFLGHLGGKHFVSLLPQPMFSMSPSAFLPSAATSALSLSQGILPSVVSPLSETSLASELQTSNMTSLQTTLGPADSSTSACNQRSVQPSQLNIHSLPVCMPPSSTVLSTLPMRQQKQQVTNPSYSSRTNVPFQPNSEKRPRNSHDSLC